MVGGALLVVFRTAIRIERVARFYSGGRRGDRVGKARGAYEVARGAATVVECRYPQFAAARDVDGPQLFADRAAVDVEHP